MPAYRSSAEAEIREPVVERLRSILPGCRIIHEINASGFGNRIDVLAVTEDQIAAVEIKSAKDKLDRLPDQIKAMNSVAHHSFAAIHEKFLHQIRDKFYPPEEAGRAVVWVYPTKARPGHVQCGLAWKERDPWSKSFATLPPRAIGMLWREELHQICRVLGVPRCSKMTMPEAIDAIRWRLTGEQITRTICATLRARECVEADPAIRAADNDNAPSIEAA